jgi:hypothetical protein
MRTHAFIPEDTTTTTLHVQKSRVTYVDGIPVLKSNMYGINEGEPSVYHEMEEKKKVRKRRWVMVRFCLI